jgi:methane/ammonia monooxygenase subunit C
MRKGIWLIFQNGVTWRKIVRQRNETATQLDGNREESSFLFNEFACIPEIPLRREWVKHSAKQVHFELVRSLIPKEVEIQRLKKIYIMVIMLGSIAASVEVDNFVDGSLHQTAIRDSAFTPAHWWLYSHFVALPLGWGFVAMYDRRVPILRGPNNSMNTGLKLTILGYLATMFTIGVNEMWHFWFVEEIFAVPNHWMFNMGVVVAFMGALAYVVRVYARLVELGAETPAKNPYVAEMYKLALEGKLYSRSIP